MKSRGYRLKKLVEIVDKLRKGIPLSPIDDDHPLKGPWESFLRWSWFPGQFGGKAKMDSGFDYAASFSSFSCIA